MPPGRIRLRIVIASDALALVNRVATALEEAEMVATSELLMDVVADACESIVKDGCVRMALRPYAELLLREITDIAERPDDHDPGGLRAAGDGRRRLSAAPCLSARTATGLRRSSSLQGKAATSAGAVEGSS